MNFLTRLICIEKEIIQTFINNEDYTDTIMSSNNNNNIKANNNNYNTDNKHSLIDRKKLKWQQDIGIFEKIK